MSEELETIYRMGIKTALSVRFNTCNDIIYLESGTYPVVCMIRKRQINFWCSLTRNIDPDSSLSKLIQNAKLINLPYIKYYENLLSVYGTAVNCEKELRAHFTKLSIQRIENAYNNDIDSKLGAYFQVNPNYTTPSFVNMFEIERINIKRIR